MKEHARNFVDLTGMRFGRIVVASFAGTLDNGMSIWNCICNCGNRFVAAGANIRKGATKSCGCLRRDMMLGNKRNAGKR